ncbi:hypothetical protein ACIQVC_08335 [Streptomyces sp. NPDC101112]|uniref:hypothetical protein n=1 Tax=Streptomyces sp. NPDC101112 TaxID=3366105 RepID=UPI0037FA2937
MTASGQEWHASGDHPPLVTSCGRRITVKCLTLTAARPITRVTLRVGPDQGDGPGVWAALTAEEARELAHRLLIHAARAESAAGTDAGAVATATGAGAARA